MTQRENASSQEANGGDHQQPSHRKLRAECCDRELKSNERDRNPREGEEHGPSVRSQCEFAHELIYRIVTWLSNVEAQRDDNEDANTCNCGDSAEAKCP